ncbi:MAG TPA: DUF1499 domain-containing protein [Stellaceae bacterium]|nr:DUF1499 domain-containing protein [Stellaceae bacterium]
MLRRRWRPMVLTLVVVIAIGLLGVRLYMGRESEDGLKPGEQVDFARLALGARDNVYLLCPPEPAYCGARPDATSPIFPVDAMALRDRLLQMVEAEPRVRLVAEDGGHRHLVFIARSALMRFPDIVTVEIVPAGPGHATLAVLSRSRYGRSDFGVNRRRVESWIETLKAAAGAV